MRALAIIVLVGMAAAAEAAPWSIELPDGYTEYPGGADDQVAQLRARPTTVTVDGQVYVSADERVHLIRITWVLRLLSPTHLVIEAMDKGAASAAEKQGFKHLSDERHWVGEQLVGDAVDDLAGNTLHHRRLYGVDASGLVHVLNATCMGPAEALGPCERALQTMQLTLPDQLAPRDRAPERKRNIPYLMGQVAGGILVAALVIWLVRRRNR
jgi:hypothetical protein